MPDDDSLTIPPATRGVTTMTDYYIAKSGVYVQGVYGPYKTSDAAKQDFDKAYNNAEGDARNFDGYHDYYIIYGLPSNVGDALFFGALPEQIMYEPKAQE